jgi:hypothetical protein
MNVQDLVTEHRVLMRQIGGLQRRSAEQWQAMRAREDALLAENMRLRAELVLLRTSVLWGLGITGWVRRAAVRRPLPRPAVVAPGTRAAQVVLCQTACVGHAHPWLGDEGLCLRSGQSCDRLTMDLPEREEPDFKR